MPSFLQSLKAEWHSWKIRNASTQADRQDTVLPFDTLEQQAHWLQAERCLITKRGNLSYRQFAVRCRQASRWAKAQGISKGDIVAIILPNQLDFLPLWMGMATNGIISWLIPPDKNYNDYKALFSQIAPKHIICSAEKFRNFKYINEELNLSARLWRHGIGTHNSLEYILSTFTQVPLDKNERSSVYLDDDALLISQTKGAIIALTHRQIIRYGTIFSAALKLSSSDRIYNLTSLASIDNGVIIPMAALQAGSSITLASDVTPSTLWQDVTASKSTIVYADDTLTQQLIAQPKAGFTDPHMVRTVFGNNLYSCSPKAVKAHLDIKSFIGYLRASNYHAPLFNLLEIENCLGYIPKFFKNNDYKLLAINKQTLHSVMRDEKYQIANPNEIGEIILPLRKQQSAPSNLINGLFKDDDKWARTSILAYLKGQNLYFTGHLDHITNWKNRLISLEKIERNLKTYSDIQAIKLHRVRHPSQSTYIPFAAITLTKQTNKRSFLNQIYRDLDKHLHPAIIRLTQHNLGKPPSINPQQDEDHLYYCDSSFGQYTRLDKSRYEQICDAKIKL